MQNAHFEVKYDIEKDIDNWLAAVKECGFGGKKWKDGLYDFYLDEFNKISSMDRAEARAELRSFIPEHFGEIIEEKKAILEERLIADFSSVCNFIESVTGKRVAMENICITLSTFPRAPYSCEEGLVYYCIFWDDVLRVLIHEMLHMQVYKYWRMNKKSLVSKLDKDDYLALNESVTFLVNESFLAECKDTGYPQYEKMRTTLEIFRKRNHNFGDMLEYGAKLLLDNKPRGNKKSRRDFDCGDELGRY